MPSYKIHSIKNNKKLSFIKEGEDEETIKKTLSLDGFIVLTIDKIEQEDNKTPWFIFEGLRENNSRVEGKVDALDIFAAYEILRNDYQYTILKLYPLDVTDPKEQENIFRNILQVFPESGQKKIQGEEPEKNISTTEVEILKKFLEILTPLVMKSGLKNKESILYDIKRVQMTTSISALEELIKRITLMLYKQSSLETKKSIYPTILPITKHLNILIFPPLVYSMVATAQNIYSILTILFGTGEKTQKIKIIKPVKKSIKWFSKPSSNNNIFTNKNIFVLMRQQYRSSWLEIFKTEGTYIYFYSFLRQYTTVFLIKKAQETFCTVMFYTGFLIVLGIIIVGFLWGPSFLFFNGFVFPVLVLTTLSLVFFIKEI